MSYSFPRLEPVPDSLKNPLWIFLIISSGIHGVLALTLPMLPQSKSSFPESVQLVELSPAEEGRLPLLDPQFSFIPGPKNPNLIAAVPLLPPSNSLPDLQLEPTNPYLPPDVGPSNSYEIPSSLAEEPTNFQFSSPTDELPVIGDRSNSQGIISIVPDTSNNRGSFDNYGDNRGNFDSPPNLDNLQPIVPPYNNQLTPPPPSFRFTEPPKIDLLPDNSRSDLKPVRDFSPDLPLPSKEVQEKIARLNLKPDVIEPDIFNPSPSSTTSPSPKPSPSSSALVSPAPSASPDSTEVTKGKGSILAKLQQHNRQSAEKKPPTNTNTNANTGVVSDEQQLMINGGEVYLAWVEKIQKDAPNLISAKPKNVEVNYPQAACAEKLNGKGLVGVAIDTDGKMIDQPKLLVSTGKEVLDQAAIEATIAFGKNLKPDQLPQQPTAYQLAFNFQYSEPSCQAKPATPNSSPSPEAEKENTTPNSPPGESEKSDTTTTPKPSPSSGEKPASSTSETKPDLIENKPEIPSGETTPDPTASPSGDESNNTTPPAN